MPRVLKESRKMKLTKGEIAEIKDLYDGSYGSIRELAGLFGVHRNTILYTVNYKGYRAWYKNWQKEWRKKNPERWKEISRKAALKWRKKNLGRARAMARKRYWENPEKYRARMRENYRKSKLKK